MWIKSVVLEYHRDISVLRLYIINLLVTDPKLTGADLLKSCYHTKCCRLTTTGWSYENDEFLIFNLKVEILNCYETVRIYFTYIFK